MSRKADENGLGSSGKYSSAQILVSMTAVRKCAFKMVGQRHHSLELASYDYHLFANMKKHAWRESISQR